MIKDKLEKIEKLVNSELSSKISGSEIVFEELLFKTSTNEITDVIKFLKFDERLKFKQLIDIAAIDYPNEEKRFELVYLLLSIENNSSSVLPVFLSIKVLAGYVSESKKYFRETSVFKPPSSRKDSKENFIICKILR